MVRPHPFEREILWHWCKLFFLYRWPLNPDGKWRVQLYGDESRVSPVPDDTKCIVDDIEAVYCPH